ncbi:MAG TPA: hypothetical protein VF191_04920 [Cyclobacteriaceae bacterium]
MFEPFGFQWISVQSVTRLHGISRPEEEITIYRQQRVDTDGETPIPALFWRVSSRAFLGLNHSESGYA